MSELMRTIWLASYPKSGNTWFRLLLANLDSDGGEEIDINDTGPGLAIASARTLFDFVTVVDSGLLTLDEIDCVRPLVHEASAHGADADFYSRPLPAREVRIVKTHDAYTWNCDGTPVLGGVKAAAGAILIVRDPRDVAPSLANHMGVSIDQAIAFLNNPDSVFCGHPHEQAPQLRQIIRDWSGFQLSWLNQTDLPVHVVRYEDMKADTVSTIAEALAFAGRSVDRDQIAHAAELVEFSKLKELEKTVGFRETPLRSTFGFFRRGESGAWREELTAGQVAAIESNHGAMMQRLGYGLSATTR